MSGGRWTADSDYDYRDVPENAPTPCATVGCDGHVTFPDRESFCTRCLIAHRERDERRNQQERDRLALIEQQVRRA